MYRTSPVRCIFFCPFLEKTREKIYFRAIFATKTRAISYHELVSLYTWITQCMRCDRLTLVIFRAIGSIFASRSAPRRARFHPRPPAGTSAAKSRSARPCCLLCASNRGISKHPPYSLQNRLIQTLHRFRLLPLSQPLARSTAPRIHPLETHPPTRHKSASTASP